MNALTVKTLPIKASVKLTADVKKKLIQITEQEFTNKQSLYHQAQQKEKDKVIAQYQKEVGWDKLKKKIDDIDSKIDKLKKDKEVIEKEIEETGLNTDGAPKSTSYYDHDLGRYVNDYSAVKLAKLLKTIEDNGPTMTLRNKLITRITLATTIGEASVIMKDILGNGLIPAIEAKDLEE